ncbi:MAG: RDD family protein [Alphaproteobacteria bacterium]
MIETDGIGTAELPAGFWRRVGAALVDIIIVAIPTLVLRYLILPEAFTFDPETFDPSQAENVWLTLILTVFYLGYKAGFESSSLRATPGKMVLRIAVTDLEYGRVSFATAAYRSWPWWFPGAADIVGTLLASRVLEWATIGLTLAGLIAFLAVAFTREKQGLHDMLANCRVVSVSRSVTLDHLTS